MLDGGGGGERVLGGYGGGLIGKTGSHNEKYYAYATGGEQDKGGIGCVMGGHYFVDSPNGGFGVGASAESETDSGSGGGGGYYGGGSTTYAGGGGGGSSYVTGYAGCDTTYIAYQGGYTFESVVISQGSNLYAPRAKITNLTFTSIY